MSRYSHKIGEDWDSVLGWSSDVTYKPSDVERYSDIYQASEALDKDLAQVKISFYEGENELGMASFIGWVDETHSAFVVEEYEVEPEGRGFEKEGIVTLRNGLRNNKMMLLVSERQLATNKSFWEKMHREGALA